MFGFPLPISWIISLIFAVIAGGSVWYGQHEANKYNEYKTEIESVGKSQEEKNKQLEKTHEIINEGIKNEYEAKLLAVRNHYAYGLHNSSSGQVSELSTAAKGTDEIASYSVLIEQCAETTVQLVTLQDWIKKEVGLDVK